MKIQPLADRIMVEVLEAKEVTKGGIVLPDTAKEKPQEAKIIAVGKGKISDEGKLIPTEVKVGDKILFGKYSGTEITVDGTEYLILKEEDILAIIK
ncbi:MAG: co-chaperone GroES [Candidatus Omnitrophota bacterium]|jgi:chaperonin GroES|nr:co-chaperone GroES [Candidatus Omnitrophota bacterium]